MADSNYIITAQIEGTQETAPTAALIEAAMRSIPLVTARTTATSDHGDFVGSARVVRRATLSLTAGRTTYVAWLYSIPDQPGLTPDQQAVRAQALSVAVRDQVATALQGMDPNWTNIVVAPYSPTSNGTIDWWRSGEASHTVTRDAFALGQQIGQMQQVDNPVGPTNGLVPANINLNPLPALPSANKTIVILGIAAVVLGLVYLGPAARAATRANPCSGDCGCEDCRRSNPEGEPVIEKSKPVRIDLERLEGRRHELVKAALEGDDLFKQAQQTLNKWALTAPPPRAYDKASFVVTYANGGTYQGRMDLQKGRPNDLVAQMRRALTTIEGGKEFLAEHIVG